MGQAPRHLVGVGELRDPVGPHEGADLDPLQARAGKRRDQPQLVIGPKLRRLVLQPVAGAHLVERDHGRAHQPRGRTLSRTHSAIDRVVAPGVKISRTPSFFSSGMSGSGMMPPPKTITSPAPSFLSRSRIAGNSVMCAPDMIERPIPSTSSCTAAATIISGVWCRPV